MLRTRLWMGSLIAALFGAVVFGDGYFAPWFPFLLIVFVGLAFPAVKEIISLQPVADRAGRISTTACVLAVLLANWYPTFAEQFPDLLPQTREPWKPVLIAATASIFAAFFVEMVKYRTPGHSMPRVANTILAIMYLGIFPSFLIKLRWLEVEYASLMIGMTMFVPKVGDIGAYFTGRILGRTPLSPWLSPKKTWEGFVGGIGLAVAASVLLWFISLEIRGAGHDVFRHGVVEAVLFGVVIGIAGVLGDLAESMLKRDSLAKDASSSVPGFGGVLDVIDSVLFASPVAYLWFSR